MESNHAASMKTRTRSTIASAVCFGDGKVPRGVRPSPGRGNIRGGELSGLLSISGATPAIVVDGRQVTSLDFHHFTPGNAQSRVGAALVGATLHVVHDAQTFDLAYGELLGVRTVRPPSRRLLPLALLPNPFNLRQKFNFRLTIVK